MRLNDIYNMHELFYLNQSRRLKTSPITEEILRVTRKHNKRERNKNNEVTGGQTSVREYIVPYKNNG